jgi:hypothetical protein
MAVKVIIPAAEVALDGEGVGLIFGVQGDGLDYDYDYEQEVNSWRGGAAIKK